MANRYLPRVVLQPSHADRVWPIAQMFLYTSHPYRVREVVATVWV